MPTAILGATRCSHRERRPRRKGARKPSRPDRSRASPTPRIVGGDGAHEPNDRSSRGRNEPRWRMPPLVLLLLLPASLSARLSPCPSASLSKKSACIFVLSFPVRHFTKARSSRRTKTNTPMKNSYEPGAPDLPQALPTEGPNGPSRTYGGRINR